MKSSLKCLAVLTAGLFACGGKQEPQTGSVHVVIAGDVGATATSAAALVSPPPAGLDAIVKVVLTATGPQAITQTFTTNLTKIDQVFSPLEVGAYVFAATAFDASDLPLFEVFGVPFTVVTQPGAAAPPVLTLILQQVRNPGTVTIPAPKITALSVDNSGPVPGQLITLSATVLDIPDPDALVPSTYTFTSKCNKPVNPGDSIAGSNQAFFTNVLPADCATGQCTITATLLSFCTDKESITFSVKDPNTSTANGSITSTVKFTIQYVQQGVEVKIAYNFFPDILSIATVDNTQPLPGGQIRLTAVVNDRDGDPLTFSWSDTCGGTFVPVEGALKTPYPKILTTWTAPAAGAVVPFPCSLILEVDDGDGFNNGALSIDVGVPPVI